MSLKEILEKIKSHGFWRVDIRPTKFGKERIKTLRECKEIIRSSVVQLTGWDYPHIGPIDPVNKLNHIESTVDFNKFVEIWRFYQSGQFIHLFACREDLMHQDPTATGSFGPEIKGTKFLGIVDTLYTITEIFEFAARLAEKNVFDPSLKITLDLFGMENRQLFFWNPAPKLFRAYVSSVNHIPVVKTLTVEELLANAPRLALDATLYIFERFNWDQPARGTLEEEQKKLLERRL
jgi:hypothetical protein